MLTGHSFVNLYLILLKSMVIRITRTYVCVYTCIFTHTCLFVAGTHTHACVGLLLSMLLTQAVLTNVYRIWAYCTLPSYIIIKLFKGKQGCTKMWHYCVEITENSIMNEVGIVVKSDHQPRRCPVEQLTHRCLLLRCDPL